MGYFQLRILTISSIRKGRRIGATYLRANICTVIRRESLPYLQTHLVADFLIKEYISGNDRLLAESNLLSNVWLLNICV